MNSHYYELLKNYRIEQAFREACAGIETDTDSQECFLRILSQTFSVAQLKNCMDLIEAGFNKGQDWMYYAFSRVHEMLQPEKSSVEIATISLETIGIDFDDPYDPDSSVPFYLGDVLASAAYFYRDGEMGYAAQPSLEKYTYLMEKAYTAGSLRAFRQKILDLIYGTDTVRKDPAKAYRILEQKVGETVFPNPEYYRLMGCADEELGRTGNAIYNYNRAAENGCGRAFFDWARASCCDPQGNIMDRNGFETILKKGIGLGVSDCYTMRAHLMDEDRFCSLDHYNQKTEHEALFKDLLTGDSLGDSFCSYFLGYYYENGKCGFAKDMDEAVRWYRRGCRLFNESCGEALDRLGVERYNYDKEVTPDDESKTEKFIKVKQNNATMSYRFSPQLPQEKQMAEFIHSALEGDVLDQIIQATGFMDNDDSKLRQNLDVTKIKVTADVMPNLYKTLLETCITLNFQRPVVMYITNSDTVNACTYIGTSKDRPVIIDINSRLLEMMNEKELRFVIGHELGHKIDGNENLDKLIRFVYEDYATMTPLLLRHKVNLWKQFCELVADRYGYLACGELWPCVSAFFKMKSGLDLDKMNMYVPAFMEYNKEILRHFSEGDYLSLGYWDHPADAIRVEALNAFANSRTQQELDERMGQIINIVSRISVGRVEQLLPYFIASAGLIIANADGKCTDDEIDNILQNMSNFHLFPIEILQRVREGDADEIFNKTVREILSIDPEKKPELLGFMVDQVMADGKIKVNEVNLILHLGVEVFGYKQQDVLGFFSQRVREVFRPKFKAIC